MQQMQFYFSHVFWNRNDFIWTLYSYPWGILTDVSILYISVFVPTDPLTHRPTDPPTHWSTDPPSHPGCTHWASVRFLPSMDSHVLGQVRLDDINGELKYDNAHRAPCPWTSCHKRCTDARSSPCACPGTASRLCSSQTLSHTLDKHTWSIDLLHFIMKQEDRGFLKKSKTRYLLYFFFFLAFLFWSLQTYQMTLKFKLFERTSKLNLKFSNSPWLAVMDDCNVVLQQKHQTFLFETLTNRIILSWDLEMRRILHRHRTSWFGTMMSRTFIVDIFQMVIQCQLSLEQDATHGAGHCRDPVCGLHVHLQAPAVIKSLSTRGALVSLAKFFWQKRTFRVELFQVVG